MDTFILPPINFISESDESILITLKQYINNTDYSQDDNFLVNSCIRHGHTQSIEFLLQQPGVNPSQNNSFSIFWRTISGFDDMVKFFYTDIRVNFGHNKNELIATIEKLDDQETFLLLLRHPSVISTSLKLGQQYHLNPLAHTEQCIKEFPEYFF